MKRRVGKRESAGRKESPALSKIMKEINQKHWTANQHYELELGVIRLLDLELKRIQQHNK